MTSTCPSSPNVAKHLLDGSRRCSIEENPTKKQHLPIEDAKDDILDTFLESIADENRKKEIIQLHTLVTKNAPTLEPTLEFANTLGYGKYHYHYQSGQEGDWIKIGITQRMNTITMHFCGLKNGKHILEAFNTRTLGQPKHVGKSCIRFHKLSDINQSLLEKIITATSKADIMT
mmetsp:Transcript_22694/g.38599  ORF Transcript_22694/g.38599 Transcript_22694/m.38599 type:complete len:174 (-) Transcript_22694:206-727(-)